MPSSSAPIPSLSLEPQVAHPNRLLPPTLNVNKLITFPGTIEDKKSLSVGSLIEKLIGHVKFNDNVHCICANIVKMSDEYRVGQRQNSLDVSDSDQLLFKELEKRGGIEFDHGNCILKLVQSVRQEESGIINESRALIVGFRLSSKELFDKALQRNKKETFQSKFSIHDGCRVTPGFHIDKGYRLFKYEIFGAESIITNLYTKSDFDDETHNECCKLLIGFIPPSISKLLISGIRKESFQLKLTAASDDADASIFLDYACCDEPSSSLTTSSSSEPLLSSNTSSSPSSSSITTSVPLSPMSISSSPHLPATTPPVVSEDASLILDCYRQATAAAKSPTITTNIQPYLICDGNILVTEFGSSRKYEIFGAEKILPILTSQLHFIPEADAYCCKLLSEHRKMPKNVKTNLQRGIFDDLSQIKLSLVNDHDGCIVLGYAKKVKNQFTYEGTIMNCDVNDIDNDVDDNDNIEEEADDDEEEEEEEHVSRKRKQHETRAIKMLSNNFRRTDYNDHGFHCRKYEKLSFKKVKNKLLALLNEEIQFDMNKKKKIINDIRKEFEQESFK